MEKFPNYNSNIENNDYPNNDCESAAEIKTEAMDDHIQERHSVKSYKELGAIGEGKDDTNTWGIVRWKGELRSIYQDEQLMVEGYVDEILKTEPQGTVRIADFGGAEGTLLRKIFVHLKAAGLEPIGATIDSALKVEGGKTAKAWEDYREQNSDSRDRVIAVPANYMTEMENININPGSLDFAISRYSAQYVPEVDRVEFFVKQVELLKPGGRLIAEWPGADDERSEQLLNSWWAQFAAITQGIDPGDFKQQQHYPTPEQVMIAAEKAGLNVISSENIEQLDLNVHETAVSNGTRFVKLDDHQKIRLRELYFSLAVHYPELVHYDEEKDSHWIRMSVGKLVSEKPLQVDGIE